MALVAGHGIADIALAGGLAGIALAGIALAGVAVGGLAGIAFAGGGLAFGLGLGAALPGALPPPAALVLASRGAFPVWSRPAGCAARTVPKFAQPS